jgi:hypothetical protein
MFFFMNRMLNSASLKKYNFIDEVLNKYHNRMKNIELCQGTLKYFYIVSYPVASDGKMLILIVSLKSKNC